MASEVSLETIKRKGSFVPFLKVRYVTMRYYVFWFFLDVGDHGGICNVNFHRPYIQDFLFDEKVCILLLGASATSTSLTWSAPLSRAIDE